MEKYKNPELSAQERAEDIVSRMTTEEKASQLRFDAPAIERLGIPAYNWWNEGLHGVARAGTATMFPQAIGLAAMFDCAAIEHAAEIIAEEGRAKYNICSSEGDRDIYKGLTYWSPNVNIFRDPRWGRGHETYGECPYLTSRLGVAFVKGLQGCGKYMKIAACAKHFAVHSGPEAIRHSFDAKASSKDMEETYLPAFEALVKEAHVEGVMGAYNRVNGEAACASEFLMGKLKDWGFDGYFVSDCWAIRDFYESHRICANAQDAAALALKRGCDCNCGNTYIHMMTAYDEGLVTDEDITKAATHLMRTRARLGCFDDKTEYDDIGFDRLACAENRAYSLECAKKSMVLLKNDGMLPLSKDKTRTIAVIGPNAASIDALRGNYYGTAASYITFLDGITRAAGDDIRVIYAQGCALAADKINNLSQPGDGYAEAVAAAKHADAVVLCVGLDATLEGEEGDTGNEFDSGDKRDLLLPQCQRILVEKVLSAGTPTVVVLAAGSSINPLADDAAAILQAWYPGEAGGEALADILFGDCSPSGKLPLTFYESADKLPAFTDYSMKNRTYRYAEGNILYPFGFGLTYSDVSVDSASCSDDKVTMKLTNIGSRACEEVAQVYIRSEDSPFEVANVRLCGFARVPLAAGETAEVTIALPQCAFEVVDDDGKRFTAGGRYTVWAGVSQPGELSERLGAPKCVKLEITR